MVWYSCLGRKTEVVWTQENVYLNSWKRVVGSGLRGRPLFRWMNKVDLLNFSTNVDMSQERNVYARKEWYRKETVMIRPPHTGEIPKGVSINGSLPFCNLLIILPP